MSNIDQSIQTLLELSRQLPIVGTRKSMGQLDQIKVGCSVAAPLLNAFGSNLQAQRLGEAASMLFNAYYRANQAYPAEIQETTFPSRESFIFSRQTMNLLQPGKGERYLLKASEFTQKFLRGYIAVIKVRPLLAVLEEFHQYIRQRKFNEAKGRLTELQRSRQAVNEAYLQMRIVIAAVKAVNQCFSPPFVKGYVQIGCELFLKLNGFFELVNGYVDRIEKELGEIDKSQERMNNPNSLFNLPNTLKDL